MLFLETKNVADTIKIVVSPACETFPSPFNQSISINQQKKAEENIISRQAKFHVNIQMELEARGKIFRVKSLFPRILIVSVFIFRV